MWCHFKSGSGREGAQIEVTYLTEVTRMVLIHQDSVVMLATGITTTTRVSSVLTDTTVTGSDVTSLLSVAVKPGGLK